MPKTIFDTISITLTLLALVSISSTIVSAHFFPNISSIPPWLASHNNTTAWDSFHKLSGCRSGDKVIGLAKLKQYFHDFGYIDPNSQANFTDDFDDALESALKTYQKNFNLDPTGRLDDETVAHIVKPRCGNPDIINGTTSMNSGKTSYHGDNSTNFHPVAHYSFFPGSPRWPRGNTDLSFAFQPENQLSEDVKNVFRRAFARWAEVIPLTFSETTWSLTADIKIGFYSGDHGDGEPFDGVLGTLAHAFSPPSGRFHLDGDETWVVSGDVTKSTVPSAVDLESVAVHEIGHVLGLGHSSVPNAIMYPTISSGQRKVALNGDDVDGIQSLYGANPNYNGTEATSSQQSETNNEYSLATSVVGPPRWSMVAFLAVGFGVLML